MFKSVYIAILLGWCGVAQAALDPTQPPVSVLTANPNASAPAVPVLQSIVRGGRQSLAVINGQTLKVGDELDGAKIRAIYAHSVVLERQGEQHVLRLVEPIMKPSR